MSHAQSGSLSAPALLTGDSVELMLQIAKRARDAGTPSTGPYRTRPRASLTRLRQHFAYLTGDLEVFARGDHKHADRGPRRGHLDVTGRPRVDLSIEFHAEEAEPSTCPSRTVAECSPTRR